MKTRILFLLSLLLGFQFPVFAQGEGAADFMESVGKMYVVVGVILVIFLGLVIYLIRLDRKIAHLENQISDND
ncbi:MAG: CcmD family protein [Bacteroidetes bacterium]|nr:CcmD family protein [Bacteroidota bacterium]